MSGFNFGQIAGELFDIMDTDIIDIWRSSGSVTPDGEYIPENSAAPLYENIPCHIAFVTADDTQTSTENIKVSETLRIHLDVGVDIIGGDYVVAKKLSNKGEIIQIYSGTVSTPKVSQARKSVLMSMNAQTEQITNLVQTGSVRSG